MKNFRFFADTAGFQVKMVKPTRLEEYPGGRKNIPLLIHLQIPS